MSLWGIYLTEVIGGFDSWEPLGGWVLASNRSCSISGAPENVDINQGLSCTIQLVSKVEYN